MSRRAEADEPARILIIDDERQNRRLLEVMLMPEGFHVSLAASGEEALDIVADQAPDLILLDVVLPGIDGYQLAGHLTNHPATRNIPIIMLSAMDDRNSRMRALNAGAVDYLAKPVDRAELCVRMRNLLRLKAYGDDRGNYREMLEGQVLSRTAELVERTTTLEEQSIVLRQNEDRTNYALGQRAWAYGSSTR